MATDRPITIESDELTAHLDAIGCRIASLVHRPSGRELLFVAPWARRPLPDGPATNAGWVAHWPGGWDLLTPNAGAPSVLDGDHRGFHGEASVERWDLHATGPGSAAGRWRDRGGLTVERSVRVEGSRLRVESTASNPTASPVAFVWVEHLILDAATVGPGARLDLSGQAIAFDETRRPSDGWDAYEPWPTVRHRGRREDWSRLPPPGTGRNGSLRDVRPPVAITGDQGPSLRMTWSVETLPFLWLWIDNHAGGALPDGAAIDCVGLEPANTVSGEGLATSLDRGDGAVLAPGAQWTSWVELDVASGEHPGRR